MAPVLLVRLARQLRHRSQLLYCRPAQHAACDACGGTSSSTLREGKARHPHKVVLRQEDSAESEHRGRFNALFASIGGTVRAMGMKWIGSFPFNRERGLPAPVRGSLLEFEFTTL